MVRFTLSPSRRWGLLDLPRLPKIKAWVDENNPGDLIIPFSVALEERLVSMSDEERVEEEKTIGATSALGKITQAGYAGLDVRPFWLWHISSYSPHL